MVDEQEGFFTVVVQGPGQPALVDEVHGPGHSPRRLEEDVATGFATMEGEDENDIELDVSRND